MIPLTDWLVLCATGILWVALLTLPSGISRWVEMRTADLRFGLDPATKRGRLGIISIQEVLRLVVGSGLMGLSYWPIMTVISAVKAMPRSTARTVLGTAFVVIAGLLLFAVRVKNLRAYAVVEMVFALIVAAQTMNSLGDTVSPIQLVAVAAAVYLLVRGMDNFKRDWDARAAAKARPAV